MTFKDANHRNLHPVVCIFLFVAGHTLFCLWAKELWVLDEVRIAGAVQEVLNGHWLLLYLSGQPYPEYPPLYFWLIAGLASLTGGLKTSLLFLATAASAFMFLWSVYALARLTSSLDKKNSLICALLLGSGLYPVFLFHYVRMDLLFSACIVFSLALIFKGLIRSNNPLLVLAGFILSGMAVLIKNPLGLAMPLVVLVLHLGFTSNLRLLLRWEVLSGVLLALLVPLSWIAAVGLTHGWPVALDIPAVEVWGRIYDSFEHQQPFFYYFLLLPLVFLPWTLIPAGCNLSKLFRGSFYRGLFSERRQKLRSANTFFSIGVPGSLLLLSAVSIKLEIFLLPLLPLVMVPAYRTWQTLPENKQNRVFFAIAGVYLVLALALITAGWLAPFSLQGCYTGAVVLLLLAVLLFRSHAFRTKLIFIILGMMFWSNVFGLFIAPSLDAVMSPQPVAETLKTYINRGYAPLAYKVSRGTYDYYAGSTIPYSNNRDTVTAILQEKEKVVLAVRRKYWERWEKPPQNLSRVGEHKIAHQAHLVFITR